MIILTGEGELFRDFVADASVKISARTGEGIEALYKAIEEIIRESRVYIDTVIPYPDGAIVSEIRRLGQLLSEDYEEDGIHIRAYAPKSVANRWRT